MSSGAPRQKNLLRKNRSAGSSEISILYGFF
jgi:hypothetical protein